MAERPGSIRLKKVKTNPQRIPNAILSLVRNPASIIPSQPLALDSGLSIELPGVATTRLTGLDV